MQRCRISQAKGQSQKRYRRKTAVEQKKRCAETKKFRKRGFLLYFSIRAMFCRKNSAGDGIFFLKTVRMCDPHLSDHTSNGKGEKKMDALNQAIAQISDVLWNSVLLFLLVGTGVYFSVRTRFVQVRKFKTAWNRVFGGFSLKGKKAGKDGMTSFQALATAIRTGRNRKHRRMCDRTRIRRPGSHLLDVACCVLRHGNDLRRGVSCADLQTPR